MGFTPKRRLRLFKGQQTTTWFIALLMVPLVYAADEDGDGHEWAGGGDAGDAAAWANGTAEAMTRWTDSPGRAESFLHALDWSPSLADRYPQLTWMHLVDALQEPTNLQRLAAGPVGAYSSTVATDPDGEPQVGQTWGPEIVYVDDLLVEDRFTDSALNGTLWTSETIGYRNDVQNGRFEVTVREVSGPHGRIDSRSIAAPMPDGGWLDVRADVNGYLGGTGWVAYPTLEVHDADNAARVASLSYHPYTNEVLRHDPAHGTVVMGTATPDADWRTYSIQLHKTGLRFTWGTMQEFVELTDFAAIQNLTVHLDYATDGADGDFQTGGFDDLEVRSVLPDYVTFAEPCISSRFAATPLAHVRYEVEACPAGGTGPGNYTWLWSDGTVTQGRYSSHDFPCGADPAVRLLVRTDAATLEQVDQVWPPGGYGDSDGDGYNDCLELYNGLNPVLIDSDQDLLHDNEEDFDGDGVFGEEGEPDPRVPDSDGDGLLDGWELGSRNLVDSPVAVGFAGGTEVLNPDTDSDGLLDGHEIVYTCPNGLDHDSDNDGIDDGDERGTYVGVEGQYVRVSQYVCDADSDDDGLKDGAELHLWDLATDHKDTDCDGKTDAQDVNPYVSNLPPGHALTPEAQATCLTLDVVAAGFTNEAIGGVPDFVHVQSDGQNLQFLTAYPNSHHPLQEISVRVRFDGTCRTAAGSEPCIASVSTPLQALPQFEDSLDGAYTHGVRVPLPDGVDTARDATGVVSYVDQALNVASVTFSIADVNLTHSTYRPQDAAEALLCSTDGTAPTADAWVDLRGTDLGRSADETILDDSGVVAAWTLRTAATPQSTGTSTPGRLVPWVQGLPHHLVVYASTADPVDLAAGTHTAEDAGRLNALLDATPVVWQGLTQDAAAAWDVATDAPTLVGSGRSGAYDVAAVLHGATWCLPDPDAALVIPHQGYLVVGSVTGLPTTSGPSDLRADLGRVAFAMDPFSQHAQGLNVAEATLSKWLDGNADDTRDFLGNASTALAALAVQAGTAELAGTGGSEELEAFYGYALFLREASEQQQTRKGAQILHDVEAPEVTATRGLLEAKLVASFLGFIANQDGEDAARTAGATWVGHGNLEDVAKAWKAVTNYAPDESLGFTRDVLALHERWAAEPARLTALYDEVAEVVSGGGRHQRDAVFQFHYAAAQASVVDLGVRYTSLTSDPVPGSSVTDAQRTTHVDVDAVLAVDPDCTSACDKVIAVVIDENGLSLDDKHWMNEVVKMEQVVDHPTLYGDVTSATLVQKNGVASAAFLEFAAGHRVEVHDAFGYCLNCDDSPRLPA